MDSSFSLRHFKGFYWKQTKFRGKSDKKEYKFTNLNGIGGGSATSLASNLFSMAEKYKNELIK